MKEKRPYETENIRILIRVLYAIASVIAILAGIGIALAGCTEGVYVGKDENVIKMILGISISILSPFVMQVLYRLTLAPFDIIDLLQDLFGEKE